MHQARDGGHGAIRTNTLIGVGMAMLEQLVGAVCLVQELESLVVVNLVSLVTFILLSRCPFLVRAPQFLG